MFSAVISRRVVRSLVSPSICQRFYGAPFHARPSFSSIHVATHSAPAKSLPLLYKAAGVSALGLGISFFATPTVHCDDKVAVVSPAPPPLPLLESTVNFYELGFGTVCGLCAGIFIKKGAKALAFILGGAFVLLQYLGSLSVVRVDWARMGSRFENLFYTTDANGHKRAPSVSSIWVWLIDFLAADFQKRASFIAGLALGLRVG